MGSKSSTASTNTTVDNTFNNVDNRVGTDGGVIGGNTNLNASSSTVGDVNITNTDYGAVQGGLSVAMSALEMGGETLDQSYDFATEIFDDSADLIGESVAKSLDFVTSATNESNAQTANAINKSLALVGETSKSEAEGVLSNFMKYATITILGIGAVYMVSKQLK